MPDSRETEALWRRVDEHGQGLTLLREQHARSEARMTAMEQRVDRAVHQLTSQHGELRSSLETWGEKMTASVDALRDEVASRRGEDKARVRLIGWAIAFLGLAIAAWKVLG